MRDHGDAACEMAWSAMRTARSRGDSDLERFFAAVALAITERTHREIANGGPADGDRPS